MHANYAVVSGVIFGLVTILQVCRALLGLPVQIGSLVVPVGASWVAAIVAGGLCFWAFRSRR